MSAHEPWGQASISALESNGQASLESRRCVPGSGSRAENHDALEAAKKGRWSGGGLPSEGVIPMLCEACQMSGEHNGWRSIALIVSVIRGSRCEGPGSTQSLPYRDTLVRKRHRRVEAEGGGNKNNPWTQVQYRAAKIDRSVSIRGCQYAPHPPNGPRTPYYRRL